jgi:hypothetical protein
VPLPPPARLDGDWPLHGSAFLGTRFALLRLALTLPGLVAAGYLLEALAPPVAPPAAATLPD